MCDNDRFIQIVATKKKQNRIYYRVILFAMEPDCEIKKHKMFSMQYKTDKVEKIYDHAKQLAECIEARIISLNWRKKMPKVKVDRYVKIQRHYKDSKPYFTINLFSEHPDEQPLGTHKQFPFRYQTENKMTADAYAYKVGKCLNIPVRN